MYIAVCQCGETICTQNRFRFVKFVSIHTGRGHQVVKTETDKPKPEVLDLPPKIVYKQDILRNVRKMRRITRNGK